MSSFTPALRFVLRWEGGFVDDPDDRGGRTNKGVTQAVYDKWRAAHGHPQKDVLHISDDEVAAIYEQNYWLRAKCDRLRDALDMTQFDTAVNMGVRRATRILQMAVGAEVDGAFGPATQAACDTCDLGTALIKYCEIRESLYRRFAKAPGQAKFLRGWMNRLNDLRHELGLPGYEAALDASEMVPADAPRINDLAEGARLEDWN